MVNVLLGVSSDLAGKLPSIFNWLLRKIYKEEDIKKRVVVDMTSSKSANRIQLLDNRNINFILRIANFTPFELTVENITLEFFWDQINKKICKNNFDRVKERSEKNVFLHESLSSEEALRIATASEKRVSEPRVSYTIDFSNRLYRFQKYGDLNSFGLEIFNQDTALEKLRNPS